jgi:hypothetical protein
VRRVTHTLAAVVLLALSMAGSAFATTLERLELDDMITKSTEIVRGQVTSMNFAQRNGVIFTQVQVKVTERWKGADSSTVEFWVRGGTYGGIRQTFAGSPAIVPGGEYVFFLWTGQRKVTQIIGLSQGLLTIRKDSKGSESVQRAGVADSVLNGSGQPSQVDAIDMPLPTLRTRVLQVLGAKE